MSGPPMSSASPPTAPPTPPGSPSGMPPPPPAPASGTTGLSGGAKAGIAIAIVVVLVLAALAFGLVPGVKLFGTSSGTSGTSSGQSVGTANSTAKPYDPGSLVLAAGVSTTYSFSLGKIPSSVTTCPVKDGLSSNFTVPAQSGSYSSGDASLWIFVYVNAATPSESIVAVVGGTGYFLGQVTGSTCVNASSIAALTGSYVSSSQAASAADGDAGSFFAAHSSANALYLLLENNTSKEPEWVIVYTNCSYNPTTNTTSGGAKADLFAAFVDGRTGSVIISAFEPGALNCSAGLDLGSGGSKTYALGMSVVASSGSGSTWDIDLALAPTSGLTTGLFGLVLRNATSENVPLASAVGGAGCTVGASFTGTSCTGVSGDWYAVLVNDLDEIAATYTLTGWSGTITLNAGYSLFVVTATSVDGIGDTLTAFATGSSDVSGSVAL